MYSVYGHGVSSMSYKDSGSCQGTEGNISWGRGVKVGDLDYPKDTEDKTEKVIQCIFTLVCLSTSVRIKQVGLRKSK